MAVLIALGSAAAQTPEVAGSPEVGAGATAESVAPTEPAAAYDAQALPGSTWEPVSENANFVRPMRFGAEVLGGTLAAGAIGGLGFLVALPVFCSGSTGGGFGSFCVLDAVVVGGLAALVAQPLGTWLTGTLLNGDGNIFATLPGPLVGLAVTALLFQGDGQGLLWWSIAGAGVASMVSALGFELTSSTSASAARGQTLSVVPTLVPGKGSGVAPGLALAGAW